MYTAHNSFTLKRSLLWIAFQFIFLVLISIILFNALAPIFFIFSFLVLVILFIFFNKKKKNYSLYQMEDCEWTLFYIDKNKVKTIYVDKFINHYLYIIVYVGEDQKESLIIWCDQLSKLKWKKLVVLTKIF